MAENEGQACVWTMERLMKQRRRWLAVWGDLEWAERYCELALP